MFHRIALTAAAALSVAGPALAGGFTPVVVTPPPATPVVPVAPVIVTNDWSGPYAGAQLGFGRSSIDFTDTVDDERVTEEGVVEGNGVIFGVHAGYMFDFGRLVAGAELDWDMSQIGLDTNDDFFEEEVEVGEIESIARAKLRLGFDAGRLLPYVTAGVARASVNLNELGEAELGEIDETYDGRFIGLGASYMVSERFMVGIEALRHDFEDLPASEDDPFPEEVDFDTTVNTLTLRGSFRF